MRSMPCRDRRNGRDDSVDQKRVVKDMERRPKVAALQGHDRAHQHAQHAELGRQNPTLKEELAEVERQREDDCVRGAVRKAEETAKARHGRGSRLLECFVDQHDRNVADDRIDAAALDALESLLDHRLLAPELLAELVAHGRGPGLADGDRLHLFFAERTSENLEQLGIDRHRGGVYQTVWWLGVRPTSPTAGGCPLPTTPCYHPPRMRVLHLAAGNRWTGAAAPAFAEVEALRAAGVDAHYAYVGGYKLQDKIGHFDFAHPVIARAQNPRSFLR